MRLQGTERDVQDVKLQRALIIGLGGTGGEILLRTRRLLINFFGDLNNIPIVRFLYIDTDTGWWQEQLTKVEKKVQLTPREFVDASVPDASPLYRDIKEGYRPNYNWFSIEKLGTITSITRGAGTIRQLGRLCFWWHYAEIRNAITSILNDLMQDRHADSMRDEHGIEIDPGINFHIVAGLAGGTGSGMFLDLAYLVRKLAVSLGVRPIEVNGYLILPQAFRDLAGALAFPNGYAALKELNYYSYYYDPDAPLAPVYGKPVWDADYLGQETDRCRFEGTPPFDHCYLLDTRNDFVDVTRQDLFAMVAQSLFHEFTLSFAQFKRSLRANIRRRMEGKPKDGNDMPALFMSFGQSSVIVPHREAQEMLAYQLALQAVQLWVDKQVEPIKVYQEREGERGERIEEKVIASIKEQAESERVKSEARGYLQREFIPNVGLRKADVLAAIVRLERERLTDLPYAWVEQVKEQWIAEKWDYDAFIGRITAEWDKWRNAFNDEGPEPMRWGEQIRKLVGNQSKALRSYRDKIYKSIYALFEDTQHYGPAFALAATRLLKEALKALHDSFIKEANNPVTIAEELGDVSLRNAAAGAPGPSLSSIIGKRIGDELGELRRAVESPWPFGKRERVEKEAYECLRWCAYWCRARVEERARRLAADLAVQLQSSLDNLELELLQHAEKLARLQQELLELAHAWRDKARKVEGVSTVLADPTILEALERQIQARQGDLYDPERVAQKALEKFGKSIRELHIDEIPQLINALIEAAKEAVGELSEKDLKDTRFAAYDLLSAKYQDDNVLRQELDTTFKKASPYVRLQDTAGTWVKNADILEIGGVGLRGGGHKENDPDKEHARVVQLLKQIDGIDPSAIKEIEDSSQIVFFQEWGRFPLRALQGMEEMKAAYEQHRRQGGTPLHIVRDEMAEQFPDLYPPNPKDLARANMIRVAGIALGFLVKRSFIETATQRTVQKYAFPKEDPILGETRYVPISEREEWIAVTLAYNPSLLEEVEKAIALKMKGADEETKEKYRQQLKQYLNGVKQRLTPKAEERGVAVEDLEEYQREADLVRSFIEKWLA